MWFFRRKTKQVRLVSAAPQGACVHVDLDATHPLAGARGALLVLAAPEQLIKAARLSRYGCDWCVWGLDRMPVVERRAAGFVASLLRAMRMGTMFVVLDASSGRAQRIAGHLMRSGCVAGEWSVTVPEREGER